MRSGIGHYVRSIKSRKHPEKNLMNRMMLESRVHLLHSLDRGTRGDEEEPEYVMVDSGINSAVQPGKVRWPKLNRDNSKLLHKDLALHPANVWALMTEMVGAQVCELYRDKTVNQFTCVGMNSSKVWIGKSRYSTAIREGRNQKLRTSQSWFAIKAEDVPQWVALTHKRHESEPDYSVEEALAGYLYGRFRMFFHVTVVGWRAEPFQLAQCSLYRGSGRNEHTKLETINIETAERGVEYVDLTKVAFPLALGPVVTGWNTSVNSEQRLQQDSKRYVVMPIRK
jgi:hypothetical protein